MGIRNILKSCDLCAVNIKYSTTNMQVFSIVLLFDFTVWFYGIAVTYEIFNESQSL